MRFENSKNEELEENGGSRGILQAEPNLTTKLKSLEEKFKSEETVNSYPQKIYAYEETDYSLSKAT